MGVSICFVPRQSLVGFSCCNLAIGHFLSEFMLGSLRQTLLNLCKPYGSYVDLFCKPIGDVLETWLWLWLCMQTQINVNMSHPWFVSQLLSYCVNE